MIRAIDNFLENRPKDDRPKHCFHPKADETEVYIQKFPFKEVGNPAGLLPILIRAIEGMA